MKSEFARELRYSFLTLAVLSSFSVSSLPAWADDQSGTVETVTVTAERRSENPQNVPISIQVLSGQTLALQNSNSMSDLSQKTPGVNVSANGRANDMFIRGIGSGLNQSFDQSVATFVDDIYAGRSRTSDATFLDVDRVEVLKGPQSTYFGNNAIAGALNIVTTKPGDQFEASVRGLYGEFGQYALEAAAGGPISDVLGARVAVIMDGDRGFLYNTNLDRHEPSNRNEAGRATLVYRPTDNLDVTLKVEGGHEHDTGAEGTFERIVGCPPTSPFTPAGFCSIALAQGLPTGLDNDKNAFAAGAGYSLDTQGAVLTANYHAWGHTFTSVTGANSYHFNVNEAANETQNDGPVLFSVHAPERYQQFSQEFRVASPSGQTFEYLAGVYFQTDQLNYAQAFNFAFQNPVLSVPPFTAFALPLGQESDVSQGEHSYAVFGSLTWNITDQLKVTGGLRGSWVQKSFSSAEYYGQASKDFGGIIPYAGTLCSAPDATTNPATGLQALASKLGLGQACAFKGNRSDSAWLPSAKVQYQFTPDAMGYFSFAKGFKAGGFNGADTTGIYSNIPYAPERVASYEVGVKTEWFNNSLLLNLDAFHSKYNDLQVSSFIVNPAPISVVNNAASAISQGFEFQGEWVVTDEFHLSANAAYLDSHYGDYPNASLTTLQTYCGTAKYVPVPSANAGCVAAFGPAGKLPTPFQDLSGRPTAFAPKWSGGLTASYSTFILNGYQLTGEVSPYFTSGYFLSGNGTDDSLEKQRSYTRWDARITLESPDSHWAVDLIGKNLSNETILTQISGLPASIGSFVASTEMPRNVSVQVRYRW